MCRRSPKIWLRWLMVKTGNWRRFGLATIDFVRSNDCDRAFSNLLIATAKLNLNGIYDILDDLIRFPPY